MEGAFTTTSGGQPYLLDFPDILRVLIYRMDSVFPRDNISPELEGTKELVYISEAVLKVETRTGYSHQAMNIFYVSL